MTLIQSCEFLRTGASAGIGAAIFKDFIKHGLTVIGLARRIDRVEELIRSSKSDKGQGHAKKCDVADPESVKETFQWIEEKFGVIHILVNNAGIVRMGGIFDGNDKTLSGMNEMFDTNVRGLLQCSVEGFKLIKKSEDNGMIININSIAGQKLAECTGKLNAYPATKHAVTALTDTMRREISASGNKKIRITSLSPGAVETEIMTAAGADMEVMKKMMEGNLVEFLKSEDVSHSVMFLLSTPYNVNISELTIQPVGEKM